MSFLDDISSSVSSSVSSAIGSATSSLQSAAKTASDALSKLSNPVQLISSLRSQNVPTNAGGAAAFTKVTFNGGASSDWRVRLSLPPNFFQTSDVFKPLKAAGGLVFPYTPSITISHSAQYDTLTPMHQNYSFSAYQSSKVDAISISGPFNVEDYVQAQYWISAVHFLRSVTKMYTGDSEFAGSPPPIIYLNGYGNYVFKNVPVIVTSFNIDLPADVDYIATTMGTEEYTSPTAANNSLGAGKDMGSSLGSAGKLLSGAAGLAGAVGAASMAKSLSKGAAAVGVAAGAIGMISNLAKSASAGGLNAAAALGGGSFTGTSSATHVPTKSTLSVTVQPIYSREAVRQFSLKTFVNGGYVDQSGGYI